jgi:hypothetical protein
MEEKIVAPVIIDNINSSNEVFGVVSPLHITDQHEMFVDRDQQELIRLDFLYQYQPSPYQVIALLTFLLLFYNAKRLVGNHLAFYTSGSLLGALASILVFAYIIHKAVPKVCFFANFLLK